MRIHHLALRTHHLDALVRFYSDLGLGVFREQPGYSVWLRAGETVLMLEQAEPDEPTVVPSRELIAFAVENLAAVEGLLRARGIAIEARTEHTLYFRDPDGRRLGVSDYAFGH